MNLRDATPKDARAIATIWNPYIRDTATTFTTCEKTPEGIAADIAARHGEGHAFVVVERGGAIVGFATYAQFRGGPGYAHSMEHSVIVAPGAQGQGVGQTLMAALVHRARAAGVHVLVAGVSHENPSAIAFHEALGFRRVGEMPEAGRKFGRWMDLILLQKVL